MKNCLFLLSLHKYTIYKITKTGAHPTMNYVKKMCILRQIKQGFSGDGKALSGLIKVEQYGKNLAVEVSIINFAPLVSGEYYCLLSDGKGKTEMLSLRGKSIFNILSDLDVSDGFCGIICFVKTDVVPIAYGINGKGSYDWRAILNATLPPVFPNSKPQKAGGEIAFDNVKDTLQEANPTPATATVGHKQNADYNDEEVATENYFEEIEDECVQPTKTNENARTQSATKNQSTEKRTNAATDGDASGVLPSHEKSSDKYYLSVKREIDELFSKYPQDETLCDAFTHSVWVRVKGTKTAPQYLVGAVYECGKVKYVCYALLAEDKDNPPSEIKDVCTFVPTSPLLNTQGFFVIFQSAATGECINPEKV